MDGHYLNTYLDWHPGSGLDSDLRPLLPPGKADLIPVEILSEIFLRTVQDWSGFRERLMLVCRRWHAIVLSTPGIHSQLTIRRATQKEIVQAFVQGTKTRLDVRVDIDDETDGSDFNPENFLACFMAAAQAASRWTSLNLISPPPLGEYTDVRVWQPLGHLESFKVARGFGGFLGPVMTAIRRGASPNLTSIEVEDSVAVLYLVQPAGVHITHSLTTLKIRLSKRMDSPVDILPHLHRLEDFEARHLCLPFYPLDASLPLVHTLRYLHLKSVSVQWMAGHVFPALTTCRITFPHHVYTIQALQPVTMPSCYSLTYNSNHLQPLTHFYLPPLSELDVKSGQWNTRRGNRQLTNLYPIFTAGALSLTFLHLDVNCSEQLLVYMLSLVPSLYFLELRLASPNALTTSFFQAFIVRESNAEYASDLVGPPSQTIALSLFSLQLQYRRWLRGPDKTALIVVFGDIMKSRNLKIHRSFKLGLRFDEAPIESWSIGPTRMHSRPRHIEEGLAKLMLGISTPHGIIPISGNMSLGCLVPLPFKEAEYLSLWNFPFHTFTEFSFTHDRMELMVDNHSRPPLPPSLPRTLPLFSALRVLVVEMANPSFLAGHTFHKLERCRVVKFRDSFLPSPRLFTETEMPVCTRVDIDDPCLLATFKLPQIHEVALDFSHPECSTIWQKHIAVNANLSGLNLLRMRGWPLNGDLIPILRSLQLLETLIISAQLGVVSFRAFLPIDANGTSGLNRTSSEGQRLDLLCPRLQSLQIEGQDPSAEPELIPILTLRAECGSALKEFAFSEFKRNNIGLRLKPGSQFELIGRNGGFTMEKVVLHTVAKEFQLDMSLV